MLLSARAISLQTDSNYLFNVLALLLDSSNLTRDALFVPSITLALASFIADGGCPGDILLRRRATNQKGKRRNNLDCSKYHSHKMGRPRAVVNIKK